MSELVTGEAVALDLRPARLPSRALAMVIDLAAQFALLLLTVWLVSLAVPDADEALAAALSLSILVLVLIGWPVAWETATHGRSLGKIALGLRVVRDDGGPVRFRQALVRALLGFFVDFWTTIGCGAVFSSLASKNGRRLGDMAAGTFVVRERTPGARQLPLPLHPAAAAWAAGIELSGLTDELALAIRQYLSRRGELDPAIEASLGERLMVDTANRIGMGPPPGMHPVVFLAAVLAERQRRDWERYTAARHGYAPTTPPPSGSESGSGWGSTPGPGPTRTPAWVPPPPPAPQSAPTPPPPSPPAPPIEPAQPTEPVQPTEPTRRKDPGFTPPS
ncbi:RDD family protein [Embleya sp. NBC_00888]|uniref:RDD family protein n=1 Tax=Embleya sp. NBC_00888 TaxID=2975960 RepID=UPI003869A5D1|nr:RDD family protein [Embleya sp. NBC_00888]